MLAAMAVGATLPGKAAEEGAAAAAVADPAGPAESAGQLRRGMP